MGRGTISLNSLPQHKKLYGNTSFYLRPIFKSGEVYFFLLRPSKDNKFLFDLEGEFGQGVKTYQMEKEDIKSGEYENTKYFYLPEDLQNCHEDVKQKILQWATDGSICSK